MEKQLEEQQLKDDQTDKITHLMGKVSFAGVEQTNSVSSVNVKSQILNPSVLEGYEKDVAFVKFMQMYLIHELPFDCVVVKMKGSYILEAICIEPEITFPSYKMMSLYNAIIQHDSQQIQIYVTTDKRTEQWSSLTLNFYHAHFVSEMPFLKGMMYLAR